MVDILSNPNNFSWLFLLHSIDCEMSLGVFIAYMVPKFIFLNASKNDLWVMAWKKSCQQSDYKLISSKIRLDKSIQA